MSETITRFSGPLIRWSLALALTAISLPAVADETGQTTAEPGFRPGSEFAATFLDSASSAEIAVLPTIVRRTERTAHSFASQKQVVTHLNDSCLLAATSKPVRIKMPPLRRPSQWEIFQFGIDTIAEKLKKYDSGADYVLVVELLAPGDQEIFGIEVYILNPQGEDAFSFLLNSHHQMFADAKLVARNSTEAARTQMFADATKLALLALKAQIEQATRPLTTAFPMLFSETPIDNVSTRLTIDPDQFHGLAAEKAMALSCACAELTTDRGFKYFRIDERDELLGGHRSFRIHFYTAPPEGFAVVGTSLDEYFTDQLDLETATMDAKGLLRACGMLARSNQAPSNP